MMPTDSLNKIRSVTIHFDNDCIGGFSFFDKDGALLWKIGWTSLGMDEETVDLAENEVIIVVFKLHGNFQSAYTDF